MINRIKDILDENVLGPVEERVNWVWEVLVRSAKGSEEVVEVAQEFVENNHQTYVFACVGAIFNLQVIVRFFAYE